MYPTWQGYLHLNITRQALDFYYLIATHPEIASAGEVLSVLVEGDGHDSVGCVESLLHAVAVVDVDVDVQNALQRTQTVKSQLLW